MAKLEIGFTVYPGQDFSPELMARVAAPYFQKADSWSTQFGVRALPVFHFDGQLQYTNWDLDLDVDYDAALELTRKLAVLFPEVRICAPTEECPPNADWFGMYTSHGAEACARLLNETCERMGIGRDPAKLRDALAWFVAERERLGREFGLTEINDTDVREQLAHRLLVRAGERGFSAEDFNEAYDVVVYS